MFGPDGGHGDPDDVTISVVNHGRLSAGRLSWYPAGLAGRSRRWLHLK